MMAHMSGEPRLLYYMPASARSSPVTRIRSVGLPTPSLRMAILGASPALSFSGLLLFGCPPYESISGLYESI